MTCRAAAHVTHELDQESWVGLVGAEVLGCLTDRRVMSLGELCERMGVSEGGMIAFLAVLAREKRIPRRSPCSSAI